MEARASRRGRTASRSRSRAPGARTPSRPRSSPQRPDPRWVAPPGRSLHRLGTELDLGPAGAYAWLSRNATRFGFLQRYSWESPNSARRRSTPSAGPAQPPAASARTRRSSRERRRAPFRTTRGGFDDTDAGADQLVEEAPGAVLGLIEGPAPPLDVRVVGDPVNGAKTSRDPAQLQALRLRRPAGRRTDRPPD